MLVTLNVKNFAIIDNINIDFQNGFTVLTGETGAGKSLIIDAISLLFGERASNDLIRYGEQKAIIEGLFSNYDSKIIDFLNDFEIDYDENEFLIIKRELYTSGKSVCKINNQTVSLNQLKSISEYIGDIHSQLETFGLINPKNYISFLRDDKIDNLINDYNDNLKQYRKYLNELNNLENKINADIQKQDFLKYQLNELVKAELSISEEEELQNELKVLSNSENVKSLIVSLKDIFNETDTLNNIYEVKEILDKLSTFDPKFSSLSKVVEEAYYNLDAVASDKIISRNNFDFDENRFNEINDRLGLYSELKRKYKKSVSEILIYIDEIKEILDKIENFDVLKEDLQINVDKFYDKTLKLAYDIRNERIKNAKILEECILSHLADLQLNNTMFKIEFNELNEIVFNKDGIDSIDFLVSFNKGEPLKPLSKTASGGELSRFMLALKTILGDKLPMQTKIFDEIDSGVSGSIAHSIGKKLYNISNNSQVLCITHLPQVAAIADNHLKISKNTVDNKTFTVIKELNYEEKVHEIASMISNGEPTAASINYAKELLIK